MGTHSEPRNTSEKAQEHSKAPSAPKHVSPDPNTQEAPPEDQQDDPTAGLQPINDDEEESAQ